MILNNVNIAGSNNAVSIRISEGKIAEIAANTLGDDEQGLQLTFTDAVVFPGLINSHDHLDFNLFPQFGHEIYNNYTAWGKHIHEAYTNEIASVLQIPVALRERWGIYKNLLCGVTTVVNHGARSHPGDELITIFENCQSLHSVRFEKGWKTKLNDLRKINRPVVMHVGEGTNNDAHHEIDELLKWNFLNRTLIGIHGVAMSPHQARHFKALVWCPESNLFLLDATARIDHLKKQTHILFGTDSTLTGNWDIWEHIRLARKTAMLTDDELYQSLTITPAATLKLNTGKIAAGFNADLLVARANHKTGSLDAFYDITPDDILLVIHKGNIRLFDESVYHQLTGTIKNGFSRVFTGGHFKYVQGDIRHLMDEIKQYKPDVSFPVHLPAKPAA